MQAQSDRLAFPRSLHVSILLAAVAFTGCASGRSARVESAPDRALSLVVHESIGSGERSFGPRADPTPRTHRVETGAEPASAAALAPRAPALLSRFCLVGGVGYSCADSSTDDDPSYEVHESHTSYNAAVGYYPLDFLSLELGYTVLGEETYELIGGGDRGSIDTEGFQLCAVGHLPVYSIFEAIARVGVFQWEEEEKENLGGTQLKFEDDGTDVIYGIGVEAAVTGNFAVRAEWAHYEAGSDYENWLLSLVWLI